MNIPVVLDIDKNTIPLTPLQQAQQRKESLTNMIKNRQAEIDRISTASVQADIDSWNKQLADLEIQIAALALDNMEKIDAG